MCDRNCEKVTCQQHGGSCKCLPGYTFNEGVCESHIGVKCKSNENCLKDRCQTAGREDCLFGCKPGWFGQFCKQSCSGHCFCEQDSGNCTSCEEGWFGTGCETRCSSGCNDKNCGRNGTCLNGCSTGSYGDTCDLKCSRHCVSGCDRLSGECVQCEAGRYGLTCQIECSDGCAGSFGDCGRDGYCTRGCRNGYYGGNCESTCPEQCYEDRCDMKGTCNNCKLGFYGTFCRQACHRCAEEICERITGTCIKGCEIGYYGSICNLTCKDCGGGECDMDTGECKDEGMQYWVGGGVTVALIIIVVGVAYISYRFKRMHGVMYDAVKWRRRPPSAVQDVSSVVAHGYVEFNDEMLPPPGCPISPQIPTIPTSYIHPRHSDISANNLQLQLGRPESYVLPNYSELNEDMMASRPQQPQGAEASAPVVSNSSFSVVADVHMELKDPEDKNNTGGEINMPLIAECFGHTETEDSPSEGEPRPEEMNYDHLFRDHYVP